MSKAILTIIPSLYGGGAEKITADLSFPLSKIFKHTTLTYNKKDSKYSIGGDLTELNLPVKHSLLGKISRQFKLYSKIVAYKRAHKPHITISHMLMANMLNIVSKKNDKVICVIHGEWSIKTGVSTALDYAVRSQYKKADMIISVSHHIKDMFVKYHSINVPHKVVQIGVDLEVIKEKSIANSSIELPQKYLVYVAGFRPVKNHLKLINQLEKFLKETDYYLVLVGDGELRGNIEESIQHLQLTEKVILTGNLKNPYPIIQGAFLSLMVSSSESFSLVVVESMALGVPVIATDCGGPAEILDPNWESKKEKPIITSNGILIHTPQFWNENSLVNQINLLGDDKGLYESISKNGKIRAEDFHISKTEKKLVSIIDDLLA